MKRILALVLILSGLLAWTPAAQAQPPAVEMTSPQVVQIFFTSEVELNALIAALDVWEVHPEAGYVVAAVVPDERAWLLKAGYTFRADPRYARHPATIPSYPCYRTINELNAQLDQWVAQYATLAELQTVGYSYEGRALRALSLTNRSQPGPKPTFFLMANIHGRELITPEIAMSFIQLLLKGYGVDPDLTWLLNYHRIVVLVSANPDGHVRNEPGEPWSWWRKNANPTHGCDSTYYGVDLNRNSSFHWGGPGASTDPCDFTYRGPSAASESETQAVQTFVSTLFPDQRGPELTDAAPLTATGLLITLHSYSNLVLWPWGDTYSPAPNQVPLQQLGRKLAGFNGYTAQQASALYPTSGATDDWSYGELGLASYTFEVGGDEDGFYPPCSRYDNLVQPNVAALRYAAKVARAPYLLSAGPETLAPTVTPTTTVGGAPVTLTATLNDHFNGDQAIAAAEAYVDTPPWITTTTPITFPLTAVDGTWNSSVEKVQAVLPAGLTYGRHTLFVRGQDAAGNWGPISAVWVWQATPQVALTLTPSAWGVELGAPLTLTLRLTNADSPATGMVVSSTLPAEVTPAWVGEGGVLTGTDVVWRGLSLATGGSLTLTCGVTVNAAPAGNRLVLAAYQTTATSWSTPVFGRPVTVAVFTRHLYLPVVLRAE